MKRSQMEIMGLTIIIVLLAFALLFVVRFMILKEDPLTKLEVVESKLAASIMSTMLKTTATDCKMHTYGDLIKNCREGMGANLVALSEEDLNESALDKGSIICDDGRQSCQYILNKAHQIFTETFNTTLKFNYKFFILSDYHLGECKEKEPNPPSDMTTNIIFEMGPGCTERRQVCQPWPTKVGTILLRLDICSGLRRYTGDPDFGHVGDVN
ncbi:hypothetical protein ACFLZX_01615 [Nanoarchaeota archaeon]